MPKLDLSRALRIKGAAGEIAQLKGPGFSWQTRLAWSPARLFEKGELGAWFDPTEISTLFQDAGGATSISDGGQLDGLALDRSKGLGAALITPENGPYLSIPSWATGSGSPQTSTIVSGAIRVAVSGSVVASVRMELSFPCVAGTGVVASVAARYVRNWVRTGVAEVARNDHGKRFYRIAAHAREDG